MGIGPNRGHSESEEESELHGGCTLVGAATPQSDPHLALYAKHSPAQINRRIGLGSSLWLGVVNSEATE